MPYTSLNSNPKNETTESIIDRVKEDLGDDISQAIQSDQTAAVPNTKALETVISEITSNSIPIETLDRFADARNELNISLNAILADVNKNLKLMVVGSKDSIKFSNVQNRLEQAIKALERR